MPSRLRALLPVAVTAICAAGLLFSAAASRTTTYYIFDRNTAACCASASHTPQEVLADLGISLAAGDTYTVKTAGTVSAITICRQQTVTVQRNNVCLTFPTTDQTAGQLLARLGWLPTEKQHCSCALDTAIYEGMVICITDLTQKRTQDDQILPAQTIFCTSSALAPGEEVTLIQGQDGLTRITTEITYAGQEELSRQVVGRKVVKEKIDRVILQGADTTQDVRSLTISGRTISYTRAITCTATAYTCESGGITATGTTPRVGAVAVDPAVIPYGTRMYIVTDDGAYIYGYATAEDCGAFRGNHVDLYLPTEAECWAFGRRSCTVYILS